MGNHKLKVLAMYTKKNFCKQTASISKHWDVFSSGSSLPTQSTGNWKKPSQREDLGSWLELEASDTWWISLNDGPGDSGILSTTQVNGVQNWELLLYTHSSHHIPWNIGDLIPSESQLNQSFSLYKFNCILWNWQLLQTPHIKRFQCSRP